MRHVIAVAAALGCLAVVALPAGAEPFNPAQEREWDFLGQLKFRGSLVKIENGKAHIRMTDGVVREFDPGRAEAITGSFLQRAMAKFPPVSAPPRVTPGAGPLIDLAAADLPAGALAQWKNAGRLGGAFRVMNQPPRVETVQGRKAVVFGHAPWLLPLEYETLASDFYMPEASIGGGALTVVAWLNNTGPAVDRETFFCWGEKDCGELDTPDFSYGCYDAMQWYDDKLSIPQARFPKLGEWHQFAFVVTPTDKDRNRLDLTLYINGERVANRLVRKPRPALLANNHAILGAAWEAWWGKKWATRPARPYTGALAALKVYDRALEPAEIRVLGGFTPRAPAAPGPVAATRPEPADGARDVVPGLHRLAWTPHPDATAQVLYLGTNKADVARGAGPSARLRGYADEAFPPIDLKLEKLAPGRTYYWRVEQITEPRQAGPAAEPWSFTTSPFDLEFDGPVSEEFPKTLKQDGFYSRYMEADGGYPIISPPGNHDIHLRAARFSMSRLFGKRPDLVKALQGSHAATHLASQEHRGWGWSHFACSSYGAGEAILREGAILLHETGHQFHMQGAEQMENDFRHRLGEVFNTARHERLWIGDYGGGNMWENVAVAASWWVNDMTQDEGGQRPNEVLRQYDPRLWHLLAAYWPGELMIDLHPASALRTDASGRLLEWGNRGGIRFFRPNFGWRFYERSVGAFAPAGAGRPVLRTVAGVSALAFAGTDTLAWNQVTWDALDGNRSWSADGWVYRDAAATGEQTLIAWGTPSAPGAKLMWGASDTAAQLPGGVTLRWTRKPAPGRWHHLAWVYTGGGLTNGPGELRVYVNGRPDNRIACTLALPAAARVTLGEGFTGALAHVRLYNYDLHPLGIEQTWTREAPAYAPAAPVVAGRLLVDLDPDVLAPGHDPESWPFYPASLNRPGLRSWVNRGTLGGKLHNDGQNPDADRPLAGPAQGAAAVSFNGRSRMISSFTGPVAPGASIELWAFAEPGAEGGTLLQWGPWALPARLLRPGAWQHVVATFGPGAATVYVNGQRAAAGAAPAGAPAAADHLILGGAWTGTGWAAGFRGHIASVRVHEGTLTAAQVTQCITQSGCLRPSRPEPGADAVAVASRQPAFSWQMGVGVGDRRGDVYLGTNATEVASATRTSPLFLGTKLPGELRPRLRPGTQYFWRVDNLTAQGQPRMRSEVWGFRTAGEVVLDLDASALPAGPVTAWASRGTAGGTFTPATERELWRPMVSVVNGRTGVDFSGRKGLVSSFAAPASLGGAASFTVSVWGHIQDFRGLEKEQTMLSWGAAPGARVEFGWGSSEKNGAFRGGSGLEFGFKGPVTQGVDRVVHNAPLTGGWRHIAYTYNGQTRKLRIYMDGRLNREESGALAVQNADRICLGGLRTGRAVDRPFGGLLSEIAIAGTVMGDADIAKLAQGTPAARVSAGWLVRLEAGDLKPGELASWTNRGTLGGEFGLEPEPPGAPPKAEQVAGRAAVTFDGSGAPLRSSIPTPAALTGDRPLTVEMWVLNPRLADQETVFALAPQIAMQSYPFDNRNCAANFNFGAAREGGRDLRPGFFGTGQMSRNVGWRETDKPASTGQWQHVACVYSGGYKGAFRAYVDGKLVNEKDFFTLDTAGGFPMHLGAGWNTARGAMNKFSGSLARLRVYDYARTEEEIRAAASGK